MSAFVAYGTVIRLPSLPFTYVPIWLPDTPSFVAKVAFAAAAVMYGVRAEAVIYPSPCTHDCVA